MSTASLPALNACLNSLATVLIVCGWAAIRRGKWKVHAGFMISALAASAAFLAGYLIHKAYHGTTSSEHMGWFRPVYLGILFSHSLLAAANLPLLAGAVTAAARRNWAGHRRWVRWALPVWLFVSVTGVLVYLILYQWFPLAAAEASRP